MIVAMRNPKTAGDLLFERFLEDRSYQFGYERDWRAVFGIDAATNPDYLVAHGGAQLLCEVKEFRTQRIRKKLPPGRAGALSSRDVYGPIRDKIGEAARTLKPFASAGLPLVVVLTNPLGADVTLDDFEVTHAILGDAQVTVTFDPKTPEVHSAVNTAGRGGVIRDHLYLSAVVTVHESLDQDWIAGILRRHRGAGGAQAATREIHQEMEDRTAPNTDRWATVYDLSWRGGAPRLANGIFAGPRDTWFGLRDGEFGKLDADEAAG